MKLLINRFIIPSLVLVAFLDQLTKHWVISSIKLGYQIPVIENFFNLTLTHNKGVAFGIFANFPDVVRTALLGVITLAAIGVLIMLLIKQYAHDTIAQFAISIILGGAIGNIIDRVRFGYVIDFLDFYLRNYHWPAFNLADSAICVGVITLIFRPGNLQK